MIIIIHEDSSTLAASHRPSISFSWCGKFSSPTIRKPRAWAACSLTCQSIVHQLVCQYSHLPNLQVATQIVSLQLTRGWNNLAKKQNKNKQTEQQKAPDINGIIWWVDQWMACSPQTRCDSVVEHRSAETESLRFDSSWELRIVSLSHARDKTKNVFYFFTELKTHHLSYSISINQCYEYCSQKDQHVIDWSTLFSFEFSKVSSSFSTTDNLLTQSSVADGPMATSKY